MVMLLYMDHNRYINNKINYLEFYNNVMYGGKKLKKNKKGINIHYHKKTSNKMQELPDLHSSILELPGLQSIIIAKDNKIIYEYGDIKYNRGYLASCRKSVIAILYGMYPIDLNKTLKELNIDDKQELTEIEKTATIKHLLTARSGIYHPASNQGDDLDKPERHSKKPNEHFVYNNWDFNVLGTIFEQETGVSIYDALDNLGKQIGFEDFDLEYNKKEYNARKEDKSISNHPPYHMFLSARDMLKIGYMMLNNGKYNEKQIVPEEWKKEITSLHTKIEKTDKRKTGYGYLWWVFDEDKDHPLHKAYLASGAEGQSIVVVPKSNMVIILKNYIKRTMLLEKIFGIKL